MTDTVVSDALAFPHDEGLPSIADGNEDWGSAGFKMALAQATDSGSYARSDTELTFTGHDGAADQVDVTGGIAFLDLTGETVSVQSTYGGTSPPAYDVNLPSLPAIAVALPTTVTNLDVQAGTLSSIWLAYATDGTVTGVSAGDVYLRSDNDGTETTPPHPSVELGEANPDDAGADVLTNRFPSPEFDVITANDITDTAVDHDLTTGVVTNEHVDHSTVTVSGGLYIDGGGDLTANRTYNFDEIQWLVDHPVPTTPQALDDTEANVIPVRVPNTSTIVVYGWGGYQITDFTAPTSLDCRLVGPGYGGTVQTTENTTWSQNTAAGTGVASHTNGSGSEALYLIQAYNGTGSTIGDPGVGLEAAWRVE